jgi:hypothetical protein
MSEPSELNEPGGGPLLRKPVGEGTLSEAAPGSDKAAPVGQRGNAASANRSPANQPGYDAARAALAPDPPNAVYMLEEAAVTAISWAKGGLSDARMSFSGDVRKVLESEFAESNSDELLFAFWSSLASLALPGIGSMLGLSSDGVSLILDTATLPGFRPAKDTDRAGVNAAEDIVSGYFNSVREQLDRAAPRMLVAAAAFGHRDKPFDVRRRLFVESLFKAEVMSAGTYFVNTAAVDKRCVADMTRLFNLSTVGIRSVRAGGHGLTLNADVTDRMAEELLPGWKAKMQRLMPDRWRFWMETNKGRIAPVAFREDLQALGRLVREAEFGVPAAASPEVRSR